MLQIKIEAHPDGHLLVQLIDKRMFVEVGLDQQSAPAEEAMKTVNDWLEATENLTTRKNIQTMVHIINKPHGLYYNGELIGIITNIDPFGKLGELCDALSPDEGLASVLPLEHKADKADFATGLDMVLDCLPETIPVQTKRYVHEDHFAADDDAFDPSN